MRASSMAWIVSIICELYSIAKRVCDARPTLEGTTDAPDSDSNNVPRGRAPFEQRGENSEPRFMQIRVILKCADNYKLERQHVETKVGVPIPVHAYVCLLTVGTPKTRAEI